MKTIVVKDHCIYLMQIDFLKKQAGITLFCVPYSPVETSGSHITFGGFCFCQYSYALWQF